MDNPIGCPCPKCGSNRSTVSNNTETRYGITRRRTCKNCNENFRTYEQVKGNLKDIPIDAILAFLDKLENEALENLLRVRKFKNEVIKNGND